MKIFSKHLILIFLVVICAYGYSLFNDFVWDDYLTIVDNKFIKSIDNIGYLLDFDKYLTAPSELPGMHLSDYGAGEMTYRPLTTLTYFVDYFFWRLNAFGYHLTNIFLHVMNVCCVYFLANMLFRRQKMALLACLLFAAHPIQSEVVLTVAFREDLLACLFMLLSLICYGRTKSIDPSKQVVCKLGSYVFYVFGLLSKETAIVLPLLILAYEYYSSCDANFCTFIKRVSQALLGYGVITVGYLFVWISAMNISGGIEATYPVGSFYINLLTMIKVFGVYLRWIIFPTDIHPTMLDDRIIAFNFLSAEVIVPLLILICCAIGIYYFTKKIWILSFALLWYFFAMLPTSNIIPTNNLLSSRYLYFPALGIYFFVSYLLDHYLSAPKEQNNGLISRPTKRVMLCMVIGCLVVLTATRSLYWKSEIIFRKYFLSHYSQNPKAYQWLAGAYIRKMRYKEALILLEQARALDQESWEIDMDIVYIHKAQRRIDRALMELEAIVKKFPHLKIALNERCLILALVSEDQAVDCFNDMILKYPAGLEAYYNLGVYYERKGMRAKALEIWRKALQVNPDFQPIIDLLN